jgi:hypothetical protein
MAGTTGHTRRKEYILEGRWPSKPPIKALAA